MYRCEVDQNSTYTFSAASSKGDTAVNVYTMDDDGTLTEYEDFDWDGAEDSGGYYRISMAYVHDVSTLYLAVLFDGEENVTLDIQKSPVIESVTIEPDVLNYAYGDEILENWKLNIKYSGDDQLKTYTLGAMYGKGFSKDERLYYYDEKYNRIYCDVFEKNTGDRYTFDEKHISPGSYIVKFLDAYGNVLDKEYEITIKNSNEDTHVHSYVSAITTPATCVDKGIRTYTCKCGDSYTEEIPVDKNNHKNVITLPAKEATCTKAGLTAGSKCEACNTIITKQIEVPVKGHANIVTLPAKAATCTATGLTEGKQCNDCKTVLTAQKTIPALGHSFENWTITKAATVVATGVQTRTCSRCGHKETRAIAKLPSSGSLNATNFPLKVKQSATLKINGMAAGDRVVSWKSGNTAFATVDANGKITGKKKGNTTITATLASGRVLTATVKVQTAAVKTTGITVNTRNVTLAQNQSFQLASVVAPFTSKDKLSYKTANKKIATVSGNGKITAKKAGKTTITVKSGKKSVKVTVNVIGVKTTGLSVNATQLNLKVKKKATIKANVTPKNTSEKVTYKTSNKKVATVDAKGKVTAKKAGTATITVTSGSKSVKVTVTVTK